MKPTIGIIIPAYNEAETLSVVLKVAASFGYPLIVVDDGSLDRSADIASGHTTHVLRHQVNLGKGAAMTSGAEYAFDRLGLDSIIYLDADGQHDPSEIERLAAELEKGAEIVLGVRDFDANMPLGRVIGNRLFSVVTQWLFGSYVPDIPCGFKAFSRQVYQQLKWEASGYEVELEIATKVAARRLPFVTVPVSTLYFNFNRGMNFLDTFKVISHLISLRLRQVY